MREGTKQFTRDESNMHEAPAWVIITMPVILIATLAAIVLLIGNLISDSGLNNTVLILIITVCLAWSGISDIVFNFHSNCRIEFRNDYIVYSFDLNRKIVASSDITTKIKIKDIDRYKIKGKNIIIYGGHITKKSPLQAEKRVKKVELPINFDERNEIIDSIKNYMKH